MLDLFMDQNFFSKIALKTLFIVFLFDSIEAKSATKNKARTKSLAVMNCTDLGLRVASTAPFIKSNFINFKLSGPLPKNGSKVVGYLRDPNNQNFVDAQLDLRTGELRLLSEYFPGNGLRDNSDILDISDDGNQLIYKTSVPPSHNAPAGWEASTLNKLDIAKGVKTQLLPAVFSISVLDTKASKGTYFGRLMIGPNQSAAFFRFSESAEGKIQLQPYVLQMPENMDRLGHWYTIEISDDGKTLTGEFDTWYRNKKSTSKHIWNLEPVAISGPRAADTDASDLGSITLVLSKNKAPQPMLSARYMGKAPKDQEIILPGERELRNQMKKLMRDGIGEQFSDYHRIIEKGTSSDGRYLVKLFEYTYTSANDPNYAHTSAVLLKWDTKNSHLPPQLVDLSYKGAPVPLSAATFYLRDDGSVILAGLSSEGVLLKSSEREGTIPLPFNKMESDELSNFPSIQFADEGNILIVQTMQGLISYDFKSRKISSEDVGRAKD